VVVFVNSHFEFWLSRLGVVFTKLRILRLFLRQGCLNYRNLTSLDLFTLFIRHPIKKLILRSLRMRPLDPCCHLLADLCCWSFLIRLHHSIDGSICPRCKLMCFFYNGCLSKKGKNRTLFLELRLSNFVNCKGFKQILALLEFGGSTH